ncbi:superfamily II DNA/RNA helicase [Parabacteroides sp. PFB2-12]|uniref:DEAD/DEAH box helicase n=1 Tax=unclassified Parabacteroides TaxID=2649774 RepID=UPI0024731AF5|nr:MULTISPECIES: DEAD/DEAH box helicase [unclassified Parabacteroides]MDH6342523.1 superfamily II DNA/RNA helicase [Parabacteroides sp. PM6-13]MDH6390175.1 superfamily II DNA/RNA helicase [Parabacteroides sp. PFB2-12]
MAENEMISRALTNAGIESLNEMQQAVLGAGTTKDMVLLSPTGSGKTLAFLLPLLTALTREEKVIQALIVAPSRELALQIETVLRSLGTGYKVNCCYGGHPFRTEKKNLEHPPTVLIATPGRLVDHIERATVNLDRVHTLVLDEFDKSLELGFLSEMIEILAHLPALRRRVLTSATEAVEIPAFTGIKSPVRLSFLSESRETKNLTLRQVRSPQKDKLETLYRLLGELQGESALVFCNLREAVERVSNYLTGEGVDNVSFHGGMEQPERERALSYFRNGSAAVFVSTDLASRGLDIPDVQHVIHYHLPLNEEAYIHRNGRTARMHASGNAYLILNPEETAPEYIDREPEEFFLPAVAKKPVPSPWVTLTINRGKRDKLSKKDIVGFLFQKGGLEKEELGVVEVKESCSFAAVKREKYRSLLSRIEGEKIKNVKARFS